MLILTRKSDESVIVGNNIEIKILNVRGDQVQLGFSAPKSVAIHRKEVYQAIQHENRQAVACGEDAIAHITSSLTNRFHSGGTTERRTRARTTAEPGFNKKQSTEGGVPIEQQS